MTDSLTTREIQSLVAVKVDDARNALRKERYSTHDYYVRQKTYALANRANDALLALIANEDENTARDIRIKNLRPATIFPFIG